MMLLAITLALVAVISGWYLWLLAFASYRYVHEKFPEYAAFVYRDPRKRGVFQEGPVRTYRLVLTRLPARDSVLIQLKALSVLAWAAGIGAVLVWAATNDG
jgi:hypothetical protein